MTSEGGILGAERVDRGGIRPPIEKVQMGTFIKLVGVSPQKT